MVGQDKVEQLAQARYLFTDISWKRVSTGGKGFVRGMLKKQPGYRWTAREALDHCADVWGPALLVRPLLFITIKPTAGIGTPV